MEKNNEQEIIKDVEEIRKKFKMQNVTQEESDFTFLDHIDRLVGKIFNDTDFSIKDAIEKDVIEKWSKRSLFRKLKSWILKNTKNAFYFTFLVAITSFLVSEALLFYADEGVITGRAIFKAILTEIAFIFLSGYRAFGKIETISVAALRVGVFSLMLFVITSKTFMDSSVFTGNADSISNQVRLLEKQIEEKEKNINYYLEKNWPITVKQLSQEKDVLVNKLLELKEKQAKGDTQDMSTLVKYKAYGNAFFRVLLLFISVLITRRMFKF